MIYARCALEILSGVPDVITHLTISDAAHQVLDNECPAPEIDRLRKLADHVHAPDRLDACVASGSFSLHGMLVAPCSLHTAMALSCGLANDLLLRAGQVCLKQRRPLVLLLRETPLASHHLRRLADLSDAGAVIMPAAPGFYFRPESIDELARQLVLRALAFLDLPGLPRGFEWNPPEP